MDSDRKVEEILIRGLLAAGILLATCGQGKADFTFAEPTNLGPTVNSPFWDNDPVVSADGLSLFFDSDRPGGHGGFDVWVTTGQQSTVGLTRLPAASRRMAWSSTSSRTGSADRVVTTYG